MGASEPVICVLKKNGGRARGLRLVRGDGAGLDNRLVRGKETEKAIKIEQNKWELVNKGQGQPPPPSPPPPPPPSVSLVVIKSGTCVGLTHMTPSPSPSPPRCGNSSVGAGWKADPTSQRSFRHVATAKEEKGRCAACGCCRTHLSQSRAPAGSNKGMRSLPLFLSWCFPSTETIRLAYEGRLMRDGHLDFHTAPELWCVAQERT